MTTKDSDLEMTTELQELAWQSSTLEFDEQNENMTEEYSTTVRSNVFDEFTTEEATTTTVESKVDEGLCLGCKNLTKSAFVLFFIFSRNKDNFRTD
jgi:transglutaminase/protease-like cytokinesis protein 3